MKKIFLLLICVAVLSFTTHDEKKLKVENTLKDWQATAQNINKAVYILRNCKQDIVTAEELVGTINTMVSFVNQIDTQLKPQTDSVKLKK